MDYSVIIPIYNEEDALIPVYHSLREAMSKLGGSYEIIFVDDGSTDASVQKLIDLQARDVVIVSLAKQTGKSSALQAGFDTATGEIYITLDGDGQDDPRDIARFIDQLAFGYDVVFGWRRNRQDSFSKRLTSRLAYFIRRFLMGDKIHDVGCPLKVFRRKAIEGICFSRGLHRYFSLIMKRRGCRMTEVETAHHPRKTGCSKYGFWGRLVECTRDFFRILFIQSKPCLRQYKITSIYRRKAS